MLLVDTYNLLHATMPPALAGLELAGLARLLAGGAWHGAPAVLVCDGRPKPGDPDPEGWEGITIVYSGIGRSADEVIAERVARDSAPRRLVVVSSDRAIERAARRRRARVIASPDFVGELAKLEARGERQRAAPPRPSGPLPPGEVERWLKRFGVDGDRPLREDRESGPPQE